jgi:hypothetical protein
MDNCVGAPKELDEIRVHNVCREPFGLGRSEVGTPTRQPDDGVNGRLGGEQADQAGPDIPRGSDDDHTHVRLIPAATTHETALND